MAVTGSSYQKETLQWIKVAGLSILILTCVGLYAVLLNTLIMPHYFGGIDLYAPWTAARAFFFSHVNPYSDAVTRSIQLHIYGHTVSYKFDQFAYVYPLYFLYFLVPIMWLPYSAALSVWMAFTQVCFIVLTVLLLRQYGLGDKPVTQVLFILWAFLLYPVFAGFWFAEPSVFVCIAFGYSWWALRKQKYALAGICLGLTIVKPHVVIFPILLLLIYALYKRNFRYIFSFGATSLLLIGSSILLMPQWVVEFLINSRKYTQYTQNFPGLQILTNLLPAIPGVLVYACVSLVLGLVMVATWFPAVKKDGVFLDLALGVTLVFQLLVLPDQNSPNQIMLVIPALFLFSCLKTEGQKVALAAGVLAALVMPWLVRFYVYSPIPGNPWVIIPIPVLLLLLSSKYIVDVEYLKILPLLSRINRKNQISLPNIRRKSWLFPLAVQLEKEQSEYGAINQKLSRKPMRKNSVIELDNHKNQKAPANHSRV